MKRVGGRASLRLAFCLLIAAIVGAAAPCGAVGKASAPGGANGVEIPFRYDPPFMPFIVVQVRINGRPPAPFVVDTGVSAPLLIDKEAARRLGLLPNGMRGIMNGNVELIGASVSTVNLVGVHADDGQECVPTHVYLFEMHLLDDSYTGPRIAGVIGAPLLNQFAVEFDFVRKIMTLIPPGSVPPSVAGATTVPLAGRTEGCYITVSPQSGIRVRVAVDTGALTSSVPVTVAPYLQPEGNGFSFYRQLGFTVIGDRWRLVTYQIGDFKEKDVAVNGAPDFTYSVMGLDLLHRFRVILDFAHGKLILERAADYPQRARLPGWTGIELEGVGRGVRIRSVEVGSNAAGAGIVSGSEILTADGYTLTGLPFAVAARLVDGLAGTTATLRLRQAGHVKLVTFTRGTEFDGRRGAGAGMTLEKREGGSWLVLRVGAGSAPELAGLAAEDEIIALNGAAATHLTDWEVWQRLRARTVAVTARRKGVSRPIRVTLTDARLQAGIGAELH